jgi:hypothetical protein
LQAQGFSVGGLNYAAIGTYMTVTGFTNGVVIPNLVIPDKVTDGDGVIHPVTAIGDNAFANCTALTAITFPASLTEIGIHAFFGCTALTALTLPASLTEIGIHAFFGCTALTSVKLLPTTPPTLLTFLKSSPDLTSSPNDQKSSPNLKSSPGNAFEAIPAICTFTCPDYALPLYQANPDWVPYFGAAPADDDGDGEKPSIRPLIGSSGESIVSLYTFRGQLLRKAAVTLPATPSVLRTVLSVPSGLYILATPSSTRKIHL